MGSKEIHIVFAPLPEEDRDSESAAHEFALRTAEKFRNEFGDNCFRLEITHLSKWNMASITDKCTTDDSVKAINRIVVLLISCGSDGSVHRSVRKTTKWLKEQEGKIESVAKTTCLVVLMGHSVCKTSAEQMNDQVFSSGLRLAKALQNTFSLSESLPTATAPASLLRTQVEIEAPEDKFDCWLESWTKVLTAQIDT